MAVSRYVAPAEDIQGPRLASPFSFITSTPAYALRLIERTRQRQTGRATAAPSKVASFQDGQPDPGS